MPDFELTFDPGQILSRAVTVAIILVAGGIVAMIASRLVKRAVKARIPRIREEAPGQLAARSETMSEVASRSAVIFVWAVAGITALGQFGVNTSAMLATLGIASLAVGFAAQNIIRDFMHGFFIVTEDWYRVGEVANVAGIGGLVVGINLRRTVLRDLDGTLHNIPNSKIDMASNLTRDFSRVNLDVKVAYGQDLERVIEVINEECAAIFEDPVLGPDLLTQPAVLRVNDIGPSGLEIKILGDTKPIRQWALMGELRLRLMKRFERERIEVGWPLTKVHFGDPFPSTERPAA